MKKGNLLWGLFFIAAAALVILSKAGLLAGLNVFSIMITLLLLPVIVSSIAHVNFWGIFFPLAVLATLYDELLGIEKYTPMTALVAALFMSIGMTLLFPKKRFDPAPVLSGDGAASQKWQSKVSYENDVKLRARFSGATKIISSKNLRSVSVDATFSGVKIYFSDAYIPKAQAEVNLSVEFSGLELYVPRTWQVVNNADCSLTGITEKGFTNFEKADKALVLSGAARFSGITVIYV